MGLIAAVISLAVSIAALIKAVATTRKLEKHISQLDLDVEMLVQNNRIGKLP